MTTITQLITRTLELDEAATPGPWELEWTCMDQRTQAVYLPDDTDRNLECIEHYRTAAPLLAKECQRLQEELRDANEELRECMTVRVSRDDL